MDLSVIQSAWSQLVPWPLLLLGAVVAIGLYAQRRGVGMPPRVPYEIVGSSLRVNGSKFGGPVLLSNLLLDQARVVDLSLEQDLQPLLRTLGIGTKGYKSGWFKLRNSSNALVHVTDSTQVVCIPTTADYLLLLSAESPGEFLSELRNSKASASVARQA